MKPTFKKMFELIKTKTAAPTTSGHDSSSGTQLPSPPGPASSQNGSATRIGVRPEELSCCCKSRRKNTSSH